MRAFAPQSNLNLISRSFIISKASNFDPYGTNPKYLELHGNTKVANSTSLGSAEETLAQRSCPPLNVMFTMVESAVLAMRRAQDQVRMHFNQVMFRCQKLIQ